VNGARKRPGRALFWHRHAPDHVVNIDSAECPGDHSLGFGEHRSNDLVDQSRTVQQRIGVLCGYGGAKNIVGGNTSALPARFVTTVWPADTLKDAVSNRIGSRCRRRKPVPGGECLRRNGRARALMATSITAAMARRPLRDINGIWGTVAPDTSGIKLRPRCV
jgi:hypothetical protein